MARINQLLQNIDPVALTQELVSIVEDADIEMFKGFTITRIDQLKAALIKKCSHYAV